MAKSLTPAELKQLARLGAAARIKELEREIATLRRAFPGAVVVQTGDVEPPKSRRGRKAPMSAAEKKQVSERMRRYWAERRKAKAKAAAKGGAKRKPKGKPQPQSDAQS